MLSRQGLPIAAAAALLLPAIIVLAVLFNSQQDRQRLDVERDSLTMAQQLVALADAEVIAARRQLDIIAHSPVAFDNDRERLSRFFDLALRNNPSWRGLVMREAADGRVLLEQGRGTEDQSLRPLPRQLPEGFTTGGAFRDGRYCPCVVIHVAMAGSPRRVLTLFVDPEVFNDLLLRFQLTTEGVSGLVDREGRFLARSLDHANRVGMPASVYVRRAVAAGGEGLYRGVTLEGLENYTAYSTSPQTGLSAHIAVERRAIDNPRNLGNAAVAAAILAALVLATGLLVYAAFEMRRRRIEEQRLLGLQKAEAVSRFTGMLTHDFRNILAAIDAGVRLTLKYTKEEQTAKRAEAMGEAVERGIRLINQLLSFARGEPVEVRRLDLRQCIEATDELLSRSLGPGVSFTWLVEEDARSVRGNGDQLELALLNLAVNARDAMDGHGTFSITATREGDFAAIAACDTGPGVPPHLRERIFEAFYSTKEEGKGTGLGLAQVAGAARQAGGHVALEDNPKGGACFVIYLPLADAPAKT